MGKARNLILTLGAEIPSISFPQHESESKSSVALVVTGGAVFVSEHVPAVNFASVSEHVSAVAVNSEHVSTVAVDFDSLARGRRRFRFQGWFRF